jgi:pSer/pThr/pTyr-binding forkhead associated (FHA) protein
MALLIQITDDKKGLRILLDQPRTRIGRDPENEVSIDDELVSKIHAIIEAVPSNENKGQIEYFVQDQESTNKTYVNDEPVSLRKLQHEDIIRVGMNSFQFLDQTPEDLEETAKLHKSWIPGVYYTKKKK